MRKPRLYDLQTKQFRDDLIHEIAKDQNGGVWYQNKLCDNLVVVWVDDEMGELKLKNLLRDYKQIDQNIEQAKNELIQARQTEDSLKAAYSDGMPHGSSMSDPTYDAAVNILNENYIIRFYACKLANLQNKKLLTEIMLDILNETEKAIVVEKYINGNITWDKVGKKVFNCRKTTITKGDTAIKKMINLVS